MSVGYLYLVTPLLFQTPRLLETLEYKGGWLKVCLERWQHMGGSPGTQPKDFLSPFHAYELIISIVLARKNLIAKICAISKRLTKFSLMR